VVPAQPHSQRPPVLRIHGPDARLAKLKNESGHGGQRSAAASLLGGAFLRER